MGTDAHKDAVGVDIHVSKEAPNLILNGAFQNWTNGTNVQPNNVDDEGSPTVAQAAGERDNFFDTPFSVRYTATGAANEGGKITLSRLKASTSYGVHIRAKVTAGDTARIFTTGASVNIDQETALTDWTSLFATFTTDATPTDVVIKFVAKADGDIVWFDSLIVVEGDVIPTFAPQTGIQEGIDIFFNSLGVGVAATGTQGQIKMQAADGQDTILTFVTTTNAHEMNLFLDASLGAGSADELVMDNQGSGNTRFVIQGNNPGIRLDDSGFIANQLLNSSNGDWFFSLPNTDRKITFATKSTLTGTTSTVLTIGGANNNTTIQNPIDTASSQVLILKSGRRDPVGIDNDEGYISFFNTDSTGGIAQVEFMRQTWIATDVTNTAKAAGYQIELMQNNTLRDYMHFSAAVAADTGAIVFNEDGQDIDFRIESNSITSAFFVEGSSGNVGVGESAPAAKFEVVGNQGAGAGTIRAVAASAGTNSQISLTDSAETKFLSLVSGHSADANHAFVMDTAGDFLFGKATDEVGAGFTELMRIASGGEVFMPFVYSDVISTSVRDLEIQNDGQLGYTVSSIKYKKNIRRGEEANIDTSWIYDVDIVKWDSKDGRLIDEIGPIAEEMVDVNQKVVSFKRIKGAIQKDGKDVYYDTDEPETIVKSKFIYPMLREVQMLRRDLNIHING